MLIRLNILSRPRHCRSALQKPRSSDLKLPGCMDETCAEVFTISRFSLSFPYRLQSQTAQRRRCAALLHNYKATVTYDGTHYYGFQVQDIARTIQGELERCLIKVLQTDRDQLKLTGSGRTDAGVHATGQVRPMSSFHVSSICSCT